MVMVALWNVSDSNNNNNNLMYDVLYSLPTGLMMFLVPYLSSGPPELLNGAVLVPWLESPNLHITYLSDFGDLYWCS